MSAERISAKKVRALLDARIAVCDDAAGRYERRGQKHQAATERCARLELEYVRGKLFPLQGGDVRGEEKVSIPGSVESSLGCAPERPLSDGWRGIDSAPPYRIPVLLIGKYPTGRGWSDVYHGWRNAGGSNWDRWPHDFRPTHWMPLPTPPTNGEEK